MPMKKNLYYVLIFNWCQTLKMLSIAGALFLCPLMLLGQQKTFTIKGSVKDKTGAVPGASILMEGTATGTISDGDGNYQLSITTDQPSARIAFSSIGYTLQTQQVTLGSGRDHHT